MSDGEPQPIDWSAVFRAGDEPRAKRANRRGLPKPTDVLPGTPEKEEVLADRQRKRQLLWHPQDATWTPTEEVIGDGKPLAIMADVERNGAVVNRHLGLQRRDRAPTAPIEESFTAEIQADAVARAASRKERA